MHMEEVRKLSQKLRSLEEAADEGKVTAEEAHSKALQVGHGRIGGGDEPGAVIIWPLLWQARLQIQGSRGGGSEEEDV